MSKYWHGGGNIVSVTVASIIASTASAQQAADATSAQATEVVLEEVIVTARKREESLQDVPLTVTAITADTINELNLKGIEDLGRFTPGFSYSSAFGRAAGSERPALRGQATILGAPVVSFFVDGVYVSGPSMSTEIGNLERIEVIKGPQSALYGRSTYAGAVNFITKKPTNELDGKVTVSFAEDSEHDFNGWMSGPVVKDKLYYFASARSYRFGGQYTNQLTGAKIGGEGNDGASLRLRWTPTESVAFDLKGTFSNIDDDHFAIMLQGREFNNCQIRNVSVNPPVLPRSRGYFCGTVLDGEDLEDRIRLRTDLFPEGGGIRSRDKRVSLTASWDFAGGYELVSQSSWHTFTEDAERDVSYGGYDPFVNLPAPIGGPASAGTFWRIEKEEREDFGQELRLSSPTAARFRWLVGAYYFKGNVGDILDDAVRPTGQIFRNAGGTISETKLENRALFGSVEFDFLDSLTASLEVRRGEDEQQLFPYSPTTYAPLVFNLPGGITTSSFEVKESSTTPRVTLRYKPSPSVSYYANAAKGTKPAAFNSGAAISSGFPIAAAEEEVKSYEIGAKTRWLNGRIQADVAAYYSDLTNQQLTTNVVLTNPTTGQQTLNSVISNIGETEIKGIEFSLNALITENWDVQFNLGFNDPEVTQGVNIDQADLYTSVPPTATPAEVRARLAAFPGTLPGTVFTNAQGNPRVFCSDGIPASVPPAAPAPAIPATSPSCATINLGVLNTDGNLAGQETPRAPRVQGSIVTRYTGKFANGLQWSIGGDVTYEGSKWVQLDNLAETGAATKVGIRLGISSDAWDVTLWGKNVFDDRTAADALRYIDTAGITPTNYTTPQFGGITPRGFALTLPRQRQFGITANYKF
jgi:outer membrane receptor protein involved in Fe transport